MRKVRKEKEEGKNRKALIKGKGRPVLRSTFAAPFLGSALSHGGR